MYLFAAMLYVLQATITRIFLHKNEWNPSSYDVSLRFLCDACNLANFPGVKHFLLYWVYDVIQCCKYYWNVQKINERCFNWFVKNFERFVNYFHAANLMTLALKWAWNGRRHKWKFWYWCILFIQLGFSWKYLP